MITWRVERVVLGVVMAFIFMIIQFTTKVYASPTDFHEQDVQFHSGNVVFDGTLLVPNGSGPHPAIVIIHGAGPSIKEDYRAEAEIFAKSGIGALIYDKRTIGYSADGVGEQSRSYALLAGDVLAAVQTLRSRADIDSTNIGLWGHSEGGWVAPLAAIQSRDVAFLITVGASGVPPIQQTSWAMENEFLHQGISSSSMIHSITRNGLRFLVSAGLFAEATYNPIPPLEQLHQPILAIWGSNDRTAPPLESSQIFQESLKRGNNQHYTIQFVPQANHMLRFSLDGFYRSDEFAPGYPEAMTLWVAEVVKGMKPGANVIGSNPQQDHFSSTEVVAPSWNDSAWLHLGVIIVLVGIFLSYFVIGLIRLFRNRNTKYVITRTHWYARIFSFVGIVSTSGFFGYFGYIMIVQDVEPVVFGRPLPWLVLQFFALLVCTFSVLLALSWRSINSTTVISERVRLRLLLVGGILFIPWAIYWKLLML